MPTVFEAHHEYEDAIAKHKQLMDSFEKKKMADGSEAPDIPASRLEEVARSTKACDDAFDTFESLRKSDVYHQKPEEKYQRTAYAAQGNDGDDAERKSVFSQIVDTVMDIERKNMRGDGGVEVKANLIPELKTTVSTSAGFAPFVSRQNIVIPTVQKRATLLDYLPIQPVSENGWSYMRESTFTNSAEVKAEGAAYDEGALAWTEVTVTPQRLGVHIPVTDVQLADAEGIQALIEDRLMEMVRIKADYQAINGNGTPPQWAGILGLAGIQTQAKGADPVFDAIYKAVSLVNNDGATTYGGANCNLIVMNPVDYQEIALARTADGVYIHGDPAVSPGMRLWGIPILMNSNLAAGTAIALDTAFFAVALRKGVRVAVTDSHGTDFIGGVLRIRVDMRGDLISYRQSAACKVTGL